MEEGVSCPQFRLYLEAAKFHYREMTINIQDRKAFIFNLLAFLPLARSVTLVFKKEFHADKRLMSWYQAKVESWKDKNVMKLFKDMRNVCLKEHVPMMLVRELVPLGVLLPSFANKNGSREVQASSEEIPSFVFALPEGVDENPDVMDLCLKYLSELEKFTIEAEVMIRKFKRFDEGMNYE